MAVQDIRSNLLPRLAFNAIINSNTTTAGSIIDTTDLDGGIVFNLLCTVFGAGTYTPVLKESDDSGMSGATDVPAANIIGSLAGAAITAVSAAGSVLNSIGAFGTKRYLQLSITSTGSTTTTIVATVEGVPEIMPSPLLSA